MGTHQAYLVNSGCIQSIFFKKLKYLSEHFYQWHLRTGLNQVVLARYLDLCFPVDFIFSGISISLLFCLPAFFPPQILYFFIKLYNETSYFSLAVYKQVQFSVGLREGQLTAVERYLYLQFRHRSFWGRNTLFKALVPDLWSNLDISSYLLSTNP